MNCSKHPDVPAKESDKFSYCPVCGLKLGPAEKKVKKAEKPVRN